MTNQMVEPTNFTERKAIRAEYQERHPPDPLACTFVSEQEQIIEDRHGNPIGRRLIRTWHNRRNGRIVAQQYGDGEIIFEAGDGGVVSVPTRREGFGMARRLLPWL
jgi:hypothetical protein